MRSRGLTLVELMIAMTLVLIATAGAIAIVAHGRASQRTSEAVATIEETTDAAFAILVDELRLAGNLGLAAPGSPVDRSSAIGVAEAAGLAVSGGCGASLAHDLAIPVTAADGSFRVDSSAPLRCTAGPSGRVVAGSDTLTIRHASVSTSVADAG